MAAIGCRHDIPASSNSVSGTHQCGDQQAQLGTVGVDSRRTLSAAPFISDAAGKTMADAPAGIDRAALSSRGSPFHGAPHLIALRI